MEKYKPINRRRMERVLPHVWDVTDLCDVIEKHGDKLMFRYYVGKDIRTMTYAEFGVQIREAAAAFTAMGLCGEKIVVIGDTSPQWLCTYLAALAAGCVIVPMDKELDINEIRGFMMQVDARAVVYSKSFNEKFIPLISETDSGIRYFIPVTPAYDNSFDSKIIAFDEVLACGRERVERDGYRYPIVRNRDTLAEMLFTSGTTGTSKCVMLCQKNIFAAVNAAVETVCFSKDDVVVSVLPVHHTYELMCLLAEMVYGIEICINDSLRHVMKNFQLFKPTGLVLVPLFLNTMYNKIWSEAKKSKKETVLKAGLATSKTLLAVGIDARRKIFKSVLAAFGGRLDHVICGGAKLNPDLIAAFEDFGISVFEGCGITECSPLTCVTPYFARKYGSVGLAVPCCRVRIDEKSGSGENEEGFIEGEIQVKGDNVMLGYYNNPEANDAAFTQDGWYRTGDIGYMDADGYVFITGRMKSVIVLENGKNVFPEEIEEYLGKIDLIAESVVVGRVEEDGSTKLTAVIFPNQEAFAEKFAGVDTDIYKEIQKEITALNKRLPSFKQIHKLEFRKTEFEKTSAKKIKRFLV